MDEETVRQLVFAAAEAVGIDPWLFMAQIKTENEDWRTDRMNALTGAEGITQADMWSGRPTLEYPRGRFGDEWNPKELMRLTNLHKLTNPTTGKPLWTEAQSEALRQVDSEGRSGFMTNPRLALAHAAALMRARMADYHAGPGSGNTLNDWKWMHDATKRREDIDRDAFIYAADKYGGRSGYGQDIEHRTPTVRTKYFDEMYGWRPSFDPLHEMVRQPGTEAGDYTPGRAVRVGAGDTLSGIVADLGIPEADQESYITAMQAVNNIPDKNAINAGQLLWLPMQSQIPSD